MPDDSLALKGPLAASADRVTDATSMGFSGRAAALWRRLRREPLVHFCLLGGLIFAADRIVHPPPDDLHTIVVTRNLRSAFIENFDEDKERVPTNSQVQAFIDGWVASEILYREGKAMGVDRGDEAIRDRIAFKLQLLIFNEINVPIPPERVLRGWFEANRNRYDEPARVGFYMTPAMDETSARGQLEAMRLGTEASDIRRQTRAYLARPVDSLASAFGDAFRDALLALPQGDWSVIHSREGWHIVRVDSFRPAVPARFEDVRDMAEREYHTEETRKRAWEAVDRLKTKYTVRYEP